MSKGGRFETCPFDILRDLFSQLYSFGDLLRREMYLPLSLHGSLPESSALRPSERAGERSLRFVAFTPLLFACQNPQQLRPIVALHDNTGYIGREGVHDQNDTRIPGVP